MHQEELGVSTSANTSTHSESTWRTLNRGDGAGGGVPGEGGGGGNPVEQELSLPFHRVLLHLPEKINNSFFDNSHGAQYTRGLNKISFFIFSVL